MKSNPPISTYLHLPQPTSTHLQLPPPNSNYLVNFPDQLLEFSLCGRPAKCTHHLFPNTYMCISASSKVNLPIPKTKPGQAPPWWSCRRHLFANKSFVETKKTIICSHHLSKNEKMSLYSESFSSDNPSRAWKDHWSENVLRVCRILAFQTYLTNHHPTDCFSWTNLSCES